MHGERPVMRPPRNATARSSTIAAPHPPVAQRHLVILPVARAEKLPADVGLWSSPLVAVTTEVAAFPLFILCVCSVQVLLVGGRVGPRLRHARSRRRDAAASEPASTV